jgi:signal transduction histidine kinase/HAMP domain-containing protein
MKLSLRLRDHPLRTQLMLIVALISIATTIVSTLTVTTLSRHRVTAALHERAARIARRLRIELAPLLAADNRPGVREILAAYAGDSELDGIEVYDTSGVPMGGFGQRPARRAPAAMLATHPGQFVVDQELTTGKGQGGWLYLSFSSLVTDAKRRDETWDALGVGSGTLLASLLVAGFPGRRIARRLGRIATAAGQFASGKPGHDVLDVAAKDEIGQLAKSFTVMVNNLNRLSHEHDRLVATQQERLEALVAERTGALERSRQMFRLMAESTRAVPFTLDLMRGCFTYIGASACVNSGIPEEAWRVPGGLEIVLPRELNPEVRRFFDDCALGRFELLTTVSIGKLHQREVRLNGTCERAAGTTTIRGLLLDITDVRRLGRELIASQKLESVGRLAAGVAHEINTPMQYVTDNVQFVGTSLAQILSVLKAYRSLKASVQSGSDAIAAAALTDKAEAAADLDYVVENTPRAIQSSLEGLRRITAIVRSMKEFAHPDRIEKEPADLNEAVRSTLVIAGNTYKLVAQLDAHYGDLPPVVCHVGEISQVILGLVINACQAMADVVKVTGHLGKLTVATRADGDFVEISVTDSGPGIPVAARDKIFDLFFTTKKIGVGTGLGLSIARNIIVTKHGGTIRFETECGKGTTFFVRLPVNPPAGLLVDAAAAAAMAAAAAANLAMESAATAALIAAAPTPNNAAPTANTAAPAAAARSAA